MIRNKALSGSMCRRTLLAAFFLVWLGGSLSAHGASDLPALQGTPEQAESMPAEPVEYSYDFSGSANLFGFLPVSAQAQLHIQVSDSSYEARLEVYRIEDEMTNTRNTYYAQHASGSVRSARLVPGNVKISWDFALEVFGAQPFRWHDDVALQFTHATDKVMVRKQNSTSDPTITEYGPDVVDLLTAFVQTYLNLKRGKQPETFTIVDRYGFTKRAEVSSRGRLLRMDFGQQVFDFKNLDVEFDETLRPTQLRVEDLFTLVDLDVVRD